MFFEISYGGGQIFHVEGQLPPLAPRSYATVCYEQLTVQAKILDCLSLYIFAGPCPGVTGENCKRQSSYPDRYVCNGYHYCNTPALIFIRCDIQHVFDIDKELCIIPYADFRCDPRCPGITFPVTSPLPQTTATTQTMHLTSSIEASTETSYVMTSPTESLISSGVPVGTRGKIDHAG